MADPLLQSNLYLFVCLFFIMSKQSHIPTIVGLSELEHTGKSKADHVSKNIILVLGYLFALSIHVHLVSYVGWRKGMG